MDDCFGKESSPRYVDSSATVWGEISHFLNESLHSRNKVGKEMFAVVGLTLDDIWSGSLPQVRLGEALKAPGTHGNSRREATRPIVIYTTDPADTQGPIARTKYKERGTFLTLLYFNDAAVEACNAFHIPLRILDHVDEGGLPAKKVIAFEHPSVAPAMK